MARFTSEGIYVKDSTGYIIGAGFGHAEIKDYEVAEFIATACNHYAEFLGSVAGLEEAGSHLTGQMELFT